MGTAKPLSQRHFRSDATESWPPVSGTPGFSRTIEICAERLPLTPTSVILDVPCGRGEALIRLARLRGIRGVGLDIGDVARDAKDRIAGAGQRGRLEVVRGEGSLLPFQDSAFDACLSIGGPTCISPDPANLQPPSFEQLVGILAEQARVVREDGYVVVSDMFFDPILDYPAARNERPDFIGWQELMRKVGLEVVLFEHFSVDAWDEYLAPRLKRAAALIERDPDDKPLKKWQQHLQQERPGGEWANYGVFLARKR